MAVINRKTHSLIKSPFPREVYTRNAEIYKLLANPKRLEILNLIQFRELSVEKLRKSLKLPKANLSQHLALLRHARLVRARRKGLNTFYKISNPRIVEPCRILRALWSSRSFD